MSRAVLVSRKYLRQLREKLGLTQNEAAKKMGMSSSDYYFIERGRKINLRVSDIEDIAYAFDIQPEVVLRMEIKYLNGGVSKANE